MEERCFSKKVYEAEKILGFNEGDFQRYFPSFSWSDFGLCRDLDNSSCEFSQSLKRIRQLRQQAGKTTSKKEYEEIFEGLGFLFSLLLYLERHCEDYTRNFVQRAPNQFEGWIADRHHNGRRKNIHVV